MNQRVVVVTGGGRGVGRAVCVRFAESGYAVVAAARSSDELQETARLVGRGGGLCAPVRCDVRSAEDVASLLQTAIDRFGRVDVLANCAGIAPLAAIDELDPQTFDDLWAINVKAIYETCRRVWPVMRAQGGGVIVNISSVASADPFPGFAAYGASKAWVNLWSKGLAEEGRPHGIRVFSVAPGAVETQMLRSAFPTYPADQCLQPADVARLIYELTQPECRFPSGDTIFIRREGNRITEKRSVS